MLGAETHVATDLVGDALTNLKMQQGADSPTAPFVVNPTDHQGKAPNFLMKVNVAEQGEDIVDVTPPDKMANVGSCHVWAGAGLPGQDVGFALPGLELEGVADLAVARQPLDVIGLGH